MKTHQEIRDAIDTIDESDDAEQRIMLILHALNDRIETSNTRFALKLSDTEQRLEEIRPTIT